MRRVARSIHQGGGNVTPLDRKTLHSRTSVSALCGCDWDNLLFATGAWCLYASLQSEK